ncbi:MAG: NTP transferase domain-containing protein [Pseudomonadota bacterium]|nr:NTP transferase domain-containing protein [Pseudomonadota bacterium]
MILGILQARMNSSRMPGKVLAPILGEPMICRQLERIRRAETLDAVVVATGRGHSDDPLAAYLTGRGVTVFRGASDDAVDRCARAAEGLAAGLGQPTHIARFFCDNPLIDPAAIDATVRLALASKAAYVHGGEHAGVEVVAAPALAEAAAEVREGRDRRELNFFFRRRADRFGQIETGADAPAWTVDSPADFAFVRAVYGALYPHDPAFTTQDVLDLLSARADLAVRSPAVAHAA